MLSGSFYGELTSAESKSIETEASSDAQRMFEDIALHRGLARFINFKNGVKEQIAKEYL
jgi:hypothetical protein